jgi:transcriptional adapter 2-alpha
MPRETYHCKICAIDITEEISIKCAECPNDFDLCLDCYSTGKEAAAHKANHSYRVIDHIKTPIFDPEWGADEELVLLEAIEACGLGNWVDAAARVKTKNSVECERHFLEAFLSRPNLCPVPLDQQTPEEKEKLGASRVLKPKPKFKKPKPPALAASVGYLYLRNEFSTPIQDEAEEVFADMELSELDPPWERDLKLKVLEIYARRLDQREQRRQLALAQGLLDDVPPAGLADPSLAYLREAMKAFARFQSPQQHKELLESMLEEKRLREQISKLQGLRQRGATRLPVRDGDSGPAEPTSSQSTSVNVYDKDRPVKKPRVAGKSEATASDTGRADVSALASGDLLSSSERALCRQLSLAPAHFFALKDRLLLEACHEGYVGEQQAQNLVPSLDPRVANRVRVFLAGQGLLALAPPMQAMQQSIQLQSALMQHQLSNSQIMSAASGMAGVLSGQAAANHSHPSQNAPNGLSNHNPHNSFGTTSYSGQTVSFHQPNTHTHTLSNVTPPAHLYPQVSLKSLITPQPRTCAHRRVVYQAL